MNDRTSDTPYFIARDENDKMQRTDLVAPARYKMVGAMLVRVWDATGGTWLLGVGELSVLHIPGSNDGRG